MDALWWRSLLYVLAFELFFHLRYRSAGSVIVWRTFLDLSKRVYCLAVSGVVNSNNNNNNNNNHNDNNHNNHKTLMSVAITGRPSSLHRAQKDNKIIYK